MASQAVLELLVTLKDQASSGLSTLGGALSSLGGIAGGAALAGVAALGAGIVSGVGDAREAAQLMAQTEAVITSTGGAAGVSAQHIAEYAGALSAASGASLFGDSQIQEAQNLLLTFTNIKDTTLDAATAIAVDMAQALGGEPKAQAIQLGKALNDPIAGISALTRVGVTFTEEQKNQIKTMQESGDVAGAQAVILAELNKEFGGSAKAAAEADGGAAQFNDRVGELMEGIGAGLLPILNQVTAFLNDSVLPAFEENVGPAVEQVGAVVMPLITQAVAALGAIWRDDLQPAINEGARFFNEDLKPILDDLGTALLPLVSYAVTVLAGYWNNALKPAIQFIWNFFKTFIIPILGEVAKWLKDNLPPAIQKATDTFNNDILPAIKTVHQWISGSLVPAIQSAAKWLGDTATKAGELAKAFGDNFQAGLRVVSDLFQTTLAGAINGAQSSIASVSGWFDDITRAVQAAVGWVQDFVDAIASVVIPDWLQGHSPPPLADWFSYIASAADAAGAAAADMGDEVASADVSAPVGGRAGAQAAESAGGGGQTAVRVYADFGELRRWLRAEVVAIQNETAGAGAGRGRLT